MKKISQVIIISVLLVFIAGCGKVAPRDAVDNFLGEYQNLSPTVIMDLEKVVSDEELTESQKDKYRSILKREYETLEYFILNEEYNDDIVSLETKISVYNLYKVQKEASDYLQDFPEEFQDSNGNYNQSLFMDYKLDIMANTNEKVEYTIIFLASKDENGNYEIIDVTESDLEKIHGIYNNTN